jgi:hypothetical protein
VACAAPRDGHPQAQGILALDFFTADLLNGSKVYVLAAIEYGTRRIWILGATEHPASVSPSSTRSGRTRESGSCELTR